MAFLGHRESLQMGACGGADPWVPLRVVRSGLRRLMDSFRPMKWIKWTSSGPPGNSITCHRIKHAMVRVESVGEMSAHHLTCCRKDEADPKDEKSFQANRFVYIRMW